MTSINVGIVEDDKNYSQVLSTILSENNQFYVTLNCATGKELIEKLPDSSVDILIIDIRLPDINGTDLLEQIQIIKPKTPCLMCTTYLESELILDSIKKGASGYMLKTEPLENIIHNIKDCLNGKTYMSSEIASKLWYILKGRKNKELPILSKRENEVLNLLSKGKQYKEIADLLNVCVDTIKKHSHNIYKKLNVKNKIEAINIVNSNYKK